MLSLERFAGNQLLCYAQSIGTVQLLYFVSTQILRGEARVEKVSRELLSTGLSGPVHLWDRALSVEDTACCRE